MPGPYAFKQIFAADPSNTSNVAKGGSVLLFAVGDASRKPLVLTDLANGMVLPNPVPINSNGFGPAFLHETLPQVAWEGGGWSGTFESFEGLRADAVAAMEASQESAQAAGDALQQAKAAAGNAASGAAGALAEAVAKAEAAKTAAQAASKLVGAPAGEAVRAAMMPGGAAYGELSGTYVRKEKVYVTDYLSSTRVPGASDDTAGFLAARTAAAGTTLVIPPGLYKISDVVEFTTDDVTVEARGAIIDLVDDGTGTGRIFRAINCGNFTWLGGQLIQTAAARTGVYGLLTLDKVEGALVDGLRTVGGSSTGLWAAEGRDHRYRAVSVQDSKADGIHISRGITDVEIDAGHFRNTGDDAIGIVSVLADGAVNYGQIKRVSVRNPIIDGTLLGGGVAFIGCTDSELVGGIIAGTNDAGVKITNDTVAGATLQSSYISVSSTLVRSSLDGYRLGEAHDCSLNGVQGIDNADTGMSLLAAVRTHVVGGKFRGNGSFGIYEGNGTGNHIKGTDLRGNTIGTHQVASAVLTDCVLA